MINLPRAGLLSLLCLTLFATTASAECAWVLWQHAQMFSNDESERRFLQGVWQPLQGFRSAADCERAAQDMKSITDYPEVFMRVREYT